ncbi:hypothetical protein LPJ57_008088 [Coemansia sp. RSA 486]|nr:hypothetical protein LPJ57_008088 [Coemansia sp. RSA 486]
MVFIEAPSEIPKRIKVPQSVKDQCKQLGIKTSGNVVGNQSYNYDGAPNLPHLAFDAPAA